MSSTEAPQQPAPLMAQMNETSKWKTILGNQNVILVIVLVVLMVYLASRNSRFFSPLEFNYLINDFCELILLAVAETFVIISGGIDLSVGSTVAISGVMGARAMQPLINGKHSEWAVIGVGILACMAVGAVVGVINALLITRFNLVPFVATLATLSAGEGLALVMANGGQPFGYNPVGTTWSSITPPGITFITWSSLSVLILLGIFGVILHFTRYGRYTFAIGSNEFAARAAGIAVRRHINSVYIWSGALAGLTGMLWDLRSGSGAPQDGIGFELIAIAAVVIGGASLTGGLGRMTGTILGAAILIVVSDGLTFINVADTWKQVVVAGCIALAAILQSLRFGGVKRT